MPVTAFKAYDIRGRVPDELNEDIAYRIGRALIAELGAKSIVVGRDMRLESPMLAQALMRGITEGGADVIDIGLCGTEEVYFATSHEQAGGGVMVTASHNPKGYNGMKLVRESSKPISGDSGLHAIRDRVATGDLGPAAPQPGAVEHKADKSAYIRHLLGYVDFAALKPLKILADPGNGAAGPVVEQLAKHLPFDWVFINREPDGHFPNGVPNPLLPENRELTRMALLDHGCDLALAWDGDFDRCFFFDADGRFIEGYYLVGLLAEMMLKRQPGAKIIHDPRLTWNTIDQVAQAGGVAIQSKTGHAFIKERMRAEDAIYGGEMSAHHYFRDFAYCDSGMIPWLLVTALMSETGKTLAQLVDERIAAFPCSGEINYRVDNIPTAIERVRAHFAAEQPIIDTTDGLSMEFADWRFNLRGSNTEPLLRLNVETRRDANALDQHVSKLEALIQGDR
ncbi:MAG: phosphomannomutase [Propionivibrio sp.]|nr:phosphomannomutase [Propionivibrio sp.]